MQQFDYDEVLDLILAKEDRFLREAYHFVREGLVFYLVENNLLAKTENDTREDFAGGYDFDEAFTAPYEPKARPEKKPQSPKAKRSK